MMLTLFILLFHLKVGERRVVWIYVVLCIAYVHLYALWNGADIFPADSR